MATTEKTPAQVIVDYYDGQLPVRSTFTPKTAREMRLDPTIALAREYAVAPILASAWTVESENEEHAKYIEEQLLPLRTKFLRTALFDEIDFGWAPFELVFTAEGEIDKIKALKIDCTRVRYDRHTGEYLGLVTDDQYTGARIYIDAVHTLFLNFDDEGLGDYASSRLERIKGVYDAWNEANDIAERFDAKMAGGIRVLKYPTGKSNFEGEETDNSEIASEILAAMKANGDVMIPVDAQNMEQATQLLEQWKVEFINTAGQQAGFVDRLKYLDALKCRAMAIPERSILEGEFGTKAEAEAHASVALLNMQLKHEAITEFLNKHLVNRLLMVKFGVEDTAKLIAMPLSDNRTAAYMEVFKMILADPGAGPEVVDHLDIKALIETLDLPLQEGAEIDVAAAREEHEQKQDERMEREAEVADV